MENLNASGSIINEDVDGKCCKAGQQDAWKIHANNNNNSLEMTTTVSSKETTEVMASAEQQQNAAVTMNNTKETQQGNAQTKRWNCESCDTATAAAALVGVGAAVSCSNYNKHNNDAAVNEAVAADVGSARLDEGGGKGVGACLMSTTQQIMEKQQHLQQNGAVTAITTPSLSALSNQQQAHAMLTLATPAASIEIPKPAAAALDSIKFDAYCAAAGVAGAASLTPPGGGGCGDNSLHSNCSGAASINNSTENLSYSSENYYPDDLILLEDDDDDAEAEEISLNSDDCMYAYRGDGADFDLALDALTRRGGGAGDAGLIDDETDFLEMDFEPDPLSEVEYGSVELAPPHADAFLLQRDSCHLSGRHSATAMGLHATPTTTSSATARHQLFSSPIDDELPPPPQTLQSQSMLSKNFACITLHLDQIKGGENGDCDVFECTRSDRASVLGISSSDIVDSVAASTTTASHSLPNALLASFGRELREEHEIKTSPSKITGAKPKRLSTFSTSSSTSSKNSSKSRTSLRSSFAPALCNSSSFDERSVSCTEFRSAPPTGADDCGSSSNVIVIANTCDDFNANDETCLDCLESEFLANTIGKVMDPNACAKCRSKHSSSIAIYARAEQAAQAQGRCRSGSPLFFGGEGVRGRSSAGDENIFDAANEFLKKYSATRKKENDCCWTAPIKNRIPTTAAATTDGAAGGNARGDVDMMMMLKNGNSSSNSSGCVGSIGVVNQRRATCDNFSSSTGGGEHLLKNLLLTDKEIVTISTMNLNEETLVQALEKLHIAYNVEFLTAHFKKQQHHHSSSANLNRNVKEFKNLKHFIMHESKKNCNHPKLKRLIEMATRHQVEVQFKEDANITQIEMVCVKVDDILHQWTRTQNLELLKQLDKRFMDANVLGKIANIIRQAQQRSCTPKRPIPEYISIPQYYPSGYLNLTKKC